MKLLKVSDIPFPEAVNGISIYLDSLIPRLGERGVETALFCQGRGRGPTRLETGEARYTLTNSPILYQNALQDPLPGLREPKTEKLFREALDRTGPDIVHFHEFIRSPVSLISLAKDSGAKVVVTLHDYWLICPRLILFTPDEEVCPGPNGGTNCVVSCLGPSFFSRLYRRVLARDSALSRVAKGLRDVVKSVKREPLGQRPSGKPTKNTGNLRFTGLIEKLRVREETNLGALNSAHLVLPVSNRVAEIFGGHGVRGEVMKVMNLGLPAPRGLVYRPRSPEKPVRIGFLGHLGPAKGSHLLVDAARSFSADEARFIIYGGGDDYAAAEMEETARSLPQLDYRGRYSREGLARILDGLDVLVMPSICEETMGLVAMEGLAAGLPVVASRIGGIPDYLEHGVNGLLFTPGSVEELLGIIARLIKEPYTIAGLSRGARGTILDMDEHTDRLVETYRGLVG